MSACRDCERCTWNPGPDCGVNAHPHCGVCEHCFGRHTGATGGRWTNPLEVLAATGEDVSQRSPAGVPLAGDGSMFRHVQAGRKR